MRITGRRAPITSTSDICSRTFSVLVMRAGVQSTKRSAQSPACSTNWRPIGGFGQLVAQAQDFPTGDQRRQRAQVRQHPLQFSQVGVVGLLQGRLLPPGIG